ncbi:MAG: hypothetical protein EBX52_03830 [Proteobacteria bacterium]|nr:hypothetical protein [Pseudomonadota bacterium]
MSTIQTLSGNSQDLAETLRSQKQQKEELQESHEREMDHLKHSYAAEKAAAQDRFESGSQAERLAHYEHLRNMKSQLSREERSLEKLGQETLRNRSDALRNEEITIEKEGRARVDDARRKAVAIEEYERQRQNEASSGVHDHHMKNTRLLMEESERALEALRTNQEKFIADQKQMHGASLLEVEDQFKMLRARETERLDEGLAMIEEGTNREIGKKIFESSERISRYESQKLDPFYQLKRFDSEMQETPDSYVLTVRVPEHERRNLRIQATPQDIQLIGIRASERDLALDGHTLSSRSHQTISEKFNLPAPVDARAVTREETAGEVRFTIPKIGPHHKGTGDSPSATARSDADSGTRDLKFAESLPRPGVSKAKTTRGVLG